MPLPAAHVFRLDNQWYAYDLNTQQLLSVEAPMADLLRGDQAADPAAHAALRRAQEVDGLFLARTPRLVPAVTAAADVDRELQHLVLTVTEACNLRCAYCLHGAELGWVRAHGTDRMSLQTALAATTYFLDRSDPARAPVISFYGGEALLNREVITETIAAARAHARGPEVRFALDSNGLLLDAEMIALIVRENLFVQLSLDGPSASHDRHRVDAAGEATHARILANLSNLLAADGCVADRLTFVVTLAPPVDLVAAAEFFAAFPPFVSQGISRQPRLTVNFANLQGQDWAPDQEAAYGLSPVPAQLERARTQYLDGLAVGRRDQLSPLLRALFEPDLIRFHHRSRAPLGDTYTPGGNCRPGRRKLHVTADGRLQPCERTGEVMALGSVETGMQVDLVNCLQDSFLVALGDRCAGCWALRQCGLCFAAQAECAGSAASQQPIPESVCRRVRDHRESVMKMMVRVLGVPREFRLWLEKSQLS